MVSADGGDLSTRVRLMRIGTDDIRLLRKFRPIVEPKLSEILDRFSEHVISLPDLQALAAQLSPASSRHRRCIDSACSPLTSTPAITTGCMV